MTAAAAAAARSLLGGGRLYLALFLVVHLVLAATTEGFTAVDVLLLVLVGVPETALVLRRRLELPFRQTLAVCTALVAAAGIGISALTVGTAGAGYSAWILGAVTFVLLGLALVGRFGSAWTTMLVITVIAIGWAVGTGQGMGVGIALVVRHIATLAVGTALAVSLRRSTAAFEAFRSARRTRSADEQAAYARSAARRSAAQTVLEQAGPTLRAIAEGRRLDEADRREMLVLEGALRDQIRTPRLVHGRLRDSVAAARRRDVNVLLLDEAVAASTAARASAAAWLADRLDADTRTSFVGRLRDGEPGGVRVTAVADEAASAVEFRSAATA